MHSLTFIKANKFYREKKNHFSKYYYKEPKPNCFLIRWRTYSASKLSFLKGCYLEVGKRKNCLTAKQIQCTYTCLLWKTETLRNPELNRKLCL